METLQVIDCSIDIFLYFSLLPAIFSIASARTSGNVAACRRRSPRPTYVRAYILDHETAYIYTIRFLRCTVKLPAASFLAASELPEHCLWRP